jgi:uncharacterized protein
MKKYSIFALLFFCYQTCFAQQTKTYSSSIKAYQKKYVSTHEVVKGSSRKFFRFFPADEKYNIKCRFERAADTSVIIMKTSGKTIPQKDFIHYGKLTFTIHDTVLQLTVYRSAVLSASNTKYKDYLFIPFTDATTGDATYGSGRYIDILTTDIKNNMVEIDFNKAYNPYCAYSNGFNCPIPPKENYLPVTITAGEKTFAKITVHSNL